MLKYIAVASSLLLTLAVLPGCEDTPESVMDDSFEWMEEMVEVLESVKDRATADDALSKVKDLVEDFEEMKERGRWMEDQVRKMSKEAQKAFREKYPPDRTMKLFGEMSRQEKRLARIPAAAEVLRAVRSLQQGPDD